MDQTVFSSPRMECEYLVSAAPADVLRYIDFKAVRHESGLFRADCVPPGTQVALFARDDRCVDIALARVATPEILQCILARRTDDGVPDPSVLEAALSNGNAGGSFWGIPKWMKRVLPWVACNGDEGQLKALFQNPQIALDAISHAMRRIEAFHGLEDKRTAAVLRYALDAPSVKRGPKDTIDGPDLSVYRVMQAVWGSLITLPPESREISAVLNIGLEGASKLMFGSPEMRRDEDESWEQVELRYLRLVLDRWRVSEKMVGEEAEFLQEQHRGIRETVVAKSNLFGDLIKSYVTNHEDVYVRRGYFAAFHQASLDELKGFEAKDGYDFLEAALRNPFFYRKSNQAVAVWLHARMSDTPSPKKAYESLQSEYGRRLKAFRKSEYPHEYFEDDYQASHPEAFAALKQEERQERLQGPPLEDIHRTLLSISSRLPAKTAGTGWLGWVVAALVGYGLAKMR